MPILRITLLVVFSFTANAGVAGPVDEVRAAQAVRIEATINDVVNEMTLRYTSVYVHKNDRWQFASWHSSRVPSAS